MDIERNETAARLQRRIVAGEPLALVGTYKRGEMTFGLTADQRAEAADNREGRE